MTPGYEEFSNDGVTMATRLLKSLYGLRQSPRCWYGTVDEHMVDIGFKSLKSDACVYIYSEGGSIYVLTLYVNDVLLLGKDRKVLERIKRKLMGRFSMTDMRDVSLVFGMEVTRDRTKGTVTITQENYVKSLLERYGMGNCNPAHTPGVGKITFIGPNGAKPFEQRRQATFPGYHGQRNVPQTGDSLRHRILL